VRRLPAVNFADRDTGRVYARTESAQLAWTDPEALGRAIADPDTRAGILAVAPGAVGHDGSTRSGATLQAAGFHTLGQWGGTSATAG